VADGRAALDAVARRDGEHGDLVVEFDEALDDAAAGAGAGALLGVFPAAGQVGGGFDNALAVAAGGHDGLEHAGEGELLGGGEGLGLGGDKTVGRGRELELFGGEAADALAVHGEFGGAGGGDDALALLLEFHEDVGGDGLDLWHDEVGLLEGDDAAQRHGVEHGEDVAAVGDLHGGGVVVAVAGDDFAAEALELDGDFLAELA